MKNLSFFIAMFLLISNALFAQVGINNDNSSPNPAAMLDVKSTTKGFLPPRMSTAQRNLIASPPEGLVIYNTDQKSLNVFDGSTWQSSATCGPVFVDSRDMKVYGAVKIGTQCWMSQNLNIGTRINAATAQTNNSVIEKYCYNDLESNCNLYGGIYQWAEAVQYLNGASNTTSWSPVPSGNIPGICPSGWHLPTEAEWMVLANYLGGETFAGGPMKEAGLYHWDPPNTSATNASGFTGLPGGYYISGWLDLGVETGFWSATEHSATTVYDPNLYYQDGQLLRFYDNKTSGMGIRCVRD